MHKDIKPKKIMFSLDGEIKLLDFGLSKWKSTGEIHTTNGTPYYLAPEVVRGVKTSKSDIWSLGVLLYCLLSGSLPFVSDSQETVYEKAQESDVHFDSKIWGQISYEAQDLISRMMDKKYHHRYNSTECLSHEWFIYALSDVKKKNYYKDFKYVKSAFSHFLTKCEIESSLAKMIDTKLKNKEIEELGIKFSELSDGKDRISSRDLCESIHGMDSSIKTEKAKQIIDQAIGNKEIDDKIYFKHIMNEIRQLKEFKKRDQIKMVFYQFCDEETDTLPLKYLKEIFEQFQIPKNEEEIKEIYGFYIEEKWIKPTTHITFQRFKEIMIDLLTNQI